MKILTATTTFEKVIKKSRFIARAGPASTAEEAMERIEQAREKKANHNCYAFSAGGAKRCSDDGEPSGTAGRPILSAIDKGGFEEVFVVVTRYFGGIKLGAGGLVRAYGGTAAGCLAQGPVKQVFPTRTIKISATFDLTGKVFAFLEQRGTHKLAEEFGAEGVTVTVAVDERQVDVFCEDLSLATKGKARVER